MLLTDAADRFLDHVRVERNAAENTFLAYRADLRQFATWSAGRGVTSVEAVDRAHVRAFLAHLIDDLGQKRVTVGRKSASLRGMFGDAVDRDVITVSPMV